MKNRKETRKARFFDLRLFPMDFGRLICCTMPLLWFRTKKLYTSEKARQKLRGGAILVANHSGFADPFLLGCTFWYRRMFFLTGEVVMRKRILRWLLQGIGCVRIDRHICDMEAIRKSVELVKSGHTLAVFPQGEIDRKDSIAEIKSGVVLIALQARVPIVPLYIHHKCNGGKRNCAVIGEPIDLNGQTGGGIPSMGDIQAATDMILDKMQQCRSIYENKLGGK